jgi:hypothetical protein
MTTTILGHVVNLMGRLDDNNNFITSSMVHKGKHFAFTKPEKETTMDISVPHDLNLKMGQYLTKRPMITLLALAMGVLMSALAFEGLMIILS